MDTLPETILADIISYVGHTDLCSVRLVSRKFYKVSLSSLIVCREKLVYMPNIRNGFSDQTAPLQTDRKFYHFLFHNANVTMEYFERLVQDQGWFIRSLEFRTCRIYDHHRFWRCLGQCKNLKSLIVWYCNASNSMRYLNFNNMTEISLASLEYLQITPFEDELSVDKFMKIAPNVRNFTVDNNSVYTPDWVLSHITDKLNRIQIIELSDDLCSNEYLSEIADLNFSDLREIRLNSSRDMSPDGLKYLIKKQRNLQVLNIKSCFVLNNEVLLTIADCLKNLKTLEIGILLERIESIFDGLISVMSRTSVRQLRLWTSGVYFITATDEINADAGIPKYNLNELNLRNLKTLPCERLEYIARNFPALTNLNLSYSNVTNDGLRIICKYLRNLKFLNLSGCGAISDDGFNTHPSFGESLGSLEELYLNDCPLISDTTVQNYFKLPYLRVLNLAYSTRLTANSFASLSDNCICLEKLNMRTIQVDGELLLKTVRSLGRLRVLHIQVSDYFTDNLLQSLYKCSNFLMEMVITNQSSFVRSWEQKKFVSV